MNEKRPKAKILASYAPEEAISYKEFVEAFKNVINQVVSIEKKLVGRDNQKIAEMEARFQEAMDMLKKLKADDFENMKSELMTMMRGMITSHESKMKELDAKLSSIRDGKDADETKIVQDVLAQIKLPEQKQVIFNPIEIRTILESLEGDDELKLSAVAKLAEEIKLLREEQTKLSKPIGGFKALRMAEFSFSGDDVTTAFKLPKTPAAKGKAVWAYLNGQEIQYGTHFTISGKTMTTTFTPATGDTLEGMIILM